MSILVEHNGVNINDYVISCDRIPNYYMNLDGTPGLPDYSMEVSNTYSGTFAHGNIINITVNGVIIHNGFIQSSEILYDSRSTRLTILPTLAYLQDHVIDNGEIVESDLLDLTSADPEKYYAELLPVGGGLPDQGAANVTLLWFLDRMFVHAGLTLDTSAVTSYSAGTAHENISPFTAITFTGGDIALDVNAIYCLNQNFACAAPLVKETTNDEGQTITDWGAVSNRPTYFEVVTQILSYFYWGIVFNGGYKIVPLATRTSASIGDDSAYQLSQRYEIKDKSFLAYQSKYTARIMYAMYAKSDLPQPYSETSGAFNNPDWKTINWMNNLWFMLRDRRTGATPGTLRPRGSDTEPLVFSPAVSGIDPTYNGPSYVGGENLIQDRVITETETGFNTSVLNVFEHYFDLGNRTTILKEVTFL